MEYSHGCAANKSGSLPSRRWRAAVLAWFAFPILILRQVALLRSWQLRDVASYAPRLIHGQHLCYVSIGFCLTRINVTERLAVSILHLIAAWNLLNGPWWGEAPMSHYCVREDLMADILACPPSQRRRRLASDRLGPTCHNRTASPVTPQSSSFLFRNIIVAENQTVR